LAHASAIGGERFIRLSIQNRSNLQLVLACTLGLVLGVLFMWLTPLTLFLILLGAAFTYAMLTRPELGLLGILVMTSSVVFEDSLPLIPIGIGSLHLPDALLLTLLGLVLVRGLVEPRFRFFRTPLNLPLLIFVGSILLSSSAAIARSSLDMRVAVRALRPLVYYFAFFAVTNLIRDDRQLRQLLRGIFLLGVVVATAMIGQYLVGASLPFLAGSVTTLETRGVVFGGVTRVVPPGRSIVLVAFVTTTAILAIESPARRRNGELLRWCLLGAALVITFLRSYWVAAAIAILILAFLERGRPLRRLMKLSLLLVTALGIILVALRLQDRRMNGNLMEGLMDRLSTLGSSSTVGESSVQFRLIENEYAIRQFARQPLLGVGMGAEYRPWDSRIDWLEYGKQGFDGRAFLHNGHLWILVESGLIAYLSLVWLSVAILVRGFRLRRAVGPLRLQAVVLGFTLSYLGVLVLAFVNSAFVDWFWTPLIGILMGVNELAVVNYRVNL